MTLTLSLSYSSPFCTFIRKVRLMMEEMTKSEKTPDYGLSGSGFSLSSPTRSEHNLRMILDRYGSLISRICFGYADSETQLEDLRQDAIINIWNGLEKFRGESDIRTWIYRITLNTCVSSLRMRARRPSAAALKELYENLTAEDESRKAMVERIHEAIGTLSPLDKAVTLAWLDEFSYDDIAVITGLSRNTVATRLRRAKETLINKLKIELAQ